ncbi:hypothetical protein P4647_09465 [Peribacillus frigoritolerans]|uniref:hypothetical protein n=1 Tax=Peribacillus TaxID=2675229 RepID=UPI002E212018|nr:hypothetical protein [Peribacillus frigoritolerans]
MIDLLITIHTLDFFLGSGNDRGDNHSKLTDALQGSERLFQVAKAIGGERS